MPRTVGRLVYESRGFIFKRLAEIDLAARRVRLLRTSFWGWTKTIVDCSLDDCVALGTVEYSADGPPWYGTYFKLRNGSWYAIPTTDVSFKTASAVVREVSAATGIPRLDIRYP
ncbi:hypothetical protein [Bradyrhizobium sp. HKCCYLS20291]|uniref:hypothetical protein n=1 Tax=Bradyrhizobium sp. HKCCYLS20291 TaxID=3420766 RepID=UPI003EBE96C8